MTVDRRKVAQRVAVWRSGRWSRAGRAASAYVEETLRLVVQLEQLKLGGDGAARERPALARRGTGSGDGQQELGRTGADATAAAPDQHIDVASPGAIEPDQQVDGAVPVDGFTDIQKNNDRAPTRGTSNSRIYAGPRTGGQSGVGDDHD